VQTKNHGEVMKRLWLGITILGAIAVLAGCPIYSDTGNYRVCTSTACYDCPDPSLSNACIAWQCSSARDCGEGYVCNGNECAPATVLPVDGSSSAMKCSNPAGCPTGSVCGQDETCHSGDCAYWGCPAGFGCFRGAYGEASCIEEVSSTTPMSATDGSADVSVAPEAAADAGAATPVDASSDATREEAASADSSGATTDAAQIPVVPPVPCNFDGQCGGGGARCVNGNCTVQSGLCSDGTQCSGGQSCVDGECTPHCSAASPCPIGFECDLNRGVCSLDASVCASTSDCLGGTVCVEAHCVAPCAPADAGAICPGGELCTNGGCLPNQAASFQCKNDGYTGAVANVCDTGEICLHGDCYVECELDAGACQPGSVCKQVTTAQGTFAVCGPASELGSGCDPAAGSYCPPGAQCIDGSCK